MPRKNCRSMKMKKGVPRNAGRMRGHQVSIMPSHRKMMKTGSWWLAAGGACGDEDAEGGFAPAPPEDAEL